MKKYSIPLLYLIFSFFLSSNIFAEPSWQAVLGGNVLVTPKATSWGFVTVSEGNLLNAFTEEGTILWQKKLKEKPSTYYSVNEDNFIYLVYDDKTRFALYNPSGVKLWEQHLSEEICETPLFGRDNRVFISTMNSISCYGINGIRKWKITTDSTNKDFALTELNDGSLLRILYKTVKENTYGLRISPYGEILEKIQFFGKIIACYSFTDGIMQVFTSDKIGCLSVKNSTAISAWGLPKSKLCPKGTGNPKIIIGKNTFCTLYKSASNSSALLSCNSQSTQTNLWNIHIPKIKLDGTEAYLYSNNKYIICSKGYAIALDETDGIIIWEKVFTEPKNKKFFTLSKSGYAIYTTSDWTICGYRLYQKLSTNTNYTIINRKKYISFPLPKKKEYPTLESISLAYSTGDYGEKELVYKWYLEKQKSIVLQDLYANKIECNIQLETEYPLVLAKSGTSDYDDTIATMIINAYDPAVVQHALVAASILGYDKNGKMLKAIGNLFSTKKTYNTQKTIICGIDAIYSICKYMGRPDFYEQGKNILMQAISNGNDETKEYTIHTFDKLINLQM